PPRRNDRPLRDLGTDHRHRRPARHGLSAEPEPTPARPDAPPSANTLDNVTTPAHVFEAAPLRVWTRS
ncbi:hypothetical protein, partial [Streptomyces sp. NPDC057582]|uniref:hypothetical protein n=1 Tax=Streptomyces sp. NPDC057582 TaxID=3346174 RepID=UPI0036769E17